jgi:hypothetical protein
MTATIDQISPTDFMIHRNASISNKKATTNDDRREEIAQLTRRLRTMKRKLLLEHAQQRQQRQQKPPKADYMKASFPFLASPSFPESMTALSYSRREERPCSSEPLRNMCGLQRSFMFD